MSRSQLFHVSWVIFVAGAAGLLYGMLTSAEPRSDSALEVRDAAVHPPASAVEWPSRAPIRSLKIESIGVAAPVVVLSATPDGVMDTPAEPMEVAWYDFSGYPGHGSNAVFAGHVDHVRTGVAVFYELRKVQAGDPVEVVLADGTSYRYVVTSSHTYDDATAPVPLIVAPTERETVTLITCIGTFDPVTQNYDRRLIVRAERI